MITNEQKRVVIDNMVKLLELPDSAYDKARKRYEDLGEWFDRDESAVSGSNPHIFPQGSFRLGTAIRPLDESEEYDLDLACKLRNGITKDSHTQETLKKVIGFELEAYRKARGIKNELEPKHRCWRLEYQDDLSFHMDIVPCIPADEKRRKAILESIRNTGLDEYVAGAASQTTISITDDQHEGYRHICENWNISNPEGYAKWFEYRMNPQKTRALLEKAQVDEMPLFKKKTPLQRVVQILKRHRDNWSKNNPDSKPISIIITTLAARAYEGETDIVEALGNVLEKMGDLVRPTKPRVPNPVDPEEDFADRWYRQDCLHLRLEEHFKAWLLQARIDFQHITSTSDTKFLCEHIEEKFSLRINEPELKKQLGISAASVTILTPKTHTIDRLDSARPWKW
ncbi:nucleotidyltransferase [Desulfuromonas acetoxidans]|uniref:nucleotidyltransferase domain-containing protein n=1 Tax=Desulfuromonas acetoxidans TaxID=891 RepID=UPI00292FD56E|nr:nucleotidyltransferase [Desulfuromonas acetoxidans]